MGRRLERTMDGNRKEQKSSLLAEERVLYHVRKDDFHLNLELSIHEQSKSTLHSVPDQPWS